MVAAPERLVAPCNFGFKPAQRLLGLRDGFLILLGFAHLDQHLLVVELTLDAADGGELVFERGALLHHALGALLVVPEAWIFSEGV